MEAIKKNRTVVARKLTRKGNELLTAIKCNSVKLDIEEKIQTVKNIMEELGTVQDDLLSLIDENDKEALGKEEKWYDEYDTRINCTIREAREYISNKYPSPDKVPSASIKLKELEIPKFEGDPKRFFKWKDIFERYTKECNEQSKYDYLLTSTVGEPLRYVENRSTFFDAMSKLEEKYGNIHVITGILVDDIRSLRVVRKGDFNAFEALSNKVNDFHDRLQLMGKKSDAENSYILKEIESKLNYDDQQKWFESRADLVDQRTVKLLRKWLDTQTHIRRISYNDSIRNSYNIIPSDGKHDRKKFGNFGSNVTNLKKCPKCGIDEHTIAGCPEYLKLTLDKRWECIKYFRCCFICLEFGHRREDCEAEPCQICSFAHHKSLHKFVMKDGDNSKVSASGTIITKYTDTQLSRSFLPVVNVSLWNGDINRSYTALLDSGSEINIITSRCYQQLKLKGDPIVINMVGVGGVINRIHTKKVDLLIEDTCGGKIAIECIVLSPACGQVLKMSTEIVEDCGSKLIHDKGIFTGGGNVDLLIGMAEPELHKQLSFESLPNGLTLMETRLGYCLVGRNRKNEETNYKCGSYQVNKVSIACEDPEEGMFRRLLQAELAGIDKERNLKTEEEIKFDERLKFDNDEGDNRFQIQIPWKYNPETFENNRKQVENRDIMLMKKLRKDNHLMLVNEQVEDMIKMGILKKVDEDYPRRYLPLLTITNLERESTKIRICMDSRCKFNGISFNDYLLNGKIDMMDLFQALTRFRCGTWAIQGDIKKMFWQIKLNEIDERYHGVIYDGKTYVFTRVCFGNKPSPAIANESMKRIAAGGRTSHPYGADVLDDKRYVDDILDASSKMEEVIQKRNETTDLLGKFGFEIKEWCSNNPDLGTVKQDGKVLGLNWDAKRDVIFNEQPQKKTVKEFTKRIVLSKLAEIWDPLGLLAGVVLVGKLIFQSIVRMKDDWDSKIDDYELESKWYTWISEIEKCHDVILPRSILPEKDIRDSMNCDMVGFSDGSSMAYGCTLYLRWYDGNEDQIVVKFIGAKSKVNSIKGTTVPRSEICGAFLLSRLAHSTELAFLKTEINAEIKDKVFFSDSTTVLSWIKSASIKYKPYVKNKVIEIQELHPIDVWRYIPSSKNNTADLMSKGCTRSNLNDIVKGPDLLYTARSTWLHVPAVINKKEVDAEKNSSVVVNAATHDDEAVLDTDRFSSWKKLVRVTAYIYKFISRKRTNSQEADIHGLTEEEFRMAEIYWIRRAQRDLDLSSVQVEKLSPFTDEEGVVRIYGRIKHMSIFDYGRKHPILLPKMHPICKMIVHQTHEHILHPGHLRVMAEVRKKFWIIGLRSLAKSVGKNCVSCRKWRGKSLEQKMADLPSFRLNPGYPFESTAIDYFGPIDVKYGYRGRKKAYGAVFTCLTTRAIHLELVSDLSTDAFLLSFRRFISLYGTPKIIRSDNGSNFVGASKEIKVMINQWKEKNVERSKLYEFCNSKLITWTFSTPTASHHNGAVESMVKSVKVSLDKLIKEKVLNEEEYRTVLAEVTACINSRPVWPSSEGDIEQPPISCIDLLKPGGLPRDPEALNLTMNPKKRYQKVQNIVNEWWQLWLFHFTPNLQRRSKWSKTRENLAIGDVVLVIDKSTPRSSWNMAIVDDVYPGPDGLVRSAKIRSKKGTYDRPITKLCLLLSKEELEQNVLE